MPTLNYGNHTIEVQNSVWGNETVKYDSKIMVKGYSALGRSYHFNVMEENQPANYEIAFKAGFLSAHITIRRNGIAIFTS